MKILEILLPKGTSNRDLSPKHVRHIDMLQNRMNQYVDRICDPKTSSAGREFLKSKLKDDYDTLRDVLSLNKEPIPEDDIPLISKQYEVYDKHTGAKVGGPYPSIKRASGIVDKKDNEYGAYRYGWREIKSLSEKLIQDMFRNAESLSEAIRKVPITVEDFELVKKLMEKPIPAIIAPIYISEIIDDDMLNDDIRSIEDTEPNRDCRPFIVEWIRRVMPDQLHRFGQEVPDWRAKDGRISPIHGYDPKDYKGTNDPVTGNAYGMR